MLSGGVWVYLGRPSQHRNCTKLLYQEPEPRELMTCSAAFGSTWRVPQTLIQNHNSSLPSLCSQYRQKVTGQEASFLRRIAVRSSKQPAPGRCRLLSFFIRSVGRFVVVMAGATKTEDMCAKTSQMGRAYVRLGVENKK